MLRRVGTHIRRQPVAFIALFIALGGTAAATSQVLHVGDAAGGNLTGTYPNPTIAAGAVTNGNLANPSLSVNSGTGLTGGGSVALGGSTTLGVADGGIGTAQVADGAVTTSKFATSAAAPNALALGGIGASHFAHDLHIEEHTTANDNTTYKTLTVTCPAGQATISGGAGIFFPTVTAQLPKLISSFAYNGGWFAEAQDDSGSGRNWYLDVQALCGTIN